MAHLKPCDVDVVLYHGNCIDGAVAAAAILLAAPRATAVPCWWSTLPAKCPDLVGRNVVCVDFTPTDTLLAELLARTSQLVVLDHHVSARETLKRLAHVAKTVFDDRECGATLAWKWVRGEAPVPRLLEYVKALDLWDWSGLGDPDAFRMCRALDQLLSLSPDALVPLLREDGGDGELARIRGALPTIDPLLDREIDRVVSTVENGRLRTAPHMAVAIINTQNFINYAAHRVLETRRNVQLVWLWYRHGGGNHVRVMLRARGGFPCHEYASFYGGGGQLNAASFTVPSDAHMWSHFM